MALIPLNAVDFRLIDIRPTVDAVTIGIEQREPIFLRGIGMSLRYEFSFGRNCAHRCYGYDCQTYQAT